MESKTNYEINDTLLVSLINEDNQDAKDFLYEKFSPMLHKEINRVRKSAYALGIDVADLSQEAMLAFTGAINSFKEEENVKFITFATLCVRRKLSSYIKKYSTNKRRVLNTAISLDTSVTDSESTVLDLVKDLDGKEPLNNLINRETLHETKSLIKEKLSDNEQKVLELATLGKDTEEIAEIMNMSNKQIYNLIHRARNKVKSI